MFKLAWGKKTDLRPTFIDLSLIVMLTISEVWRSIRAILGQLRFMRGHMIKNSKIFVTYDILRCSAFFDIKHMFQIAKI